MSICTIRPIVCKKAGNWVNNKGRRAYAATSPPCL